MATQAKQHYLSSQVFEAAAPSPVARIIHLLAGAGLQAKTKANKELVSEPIDGIAGMSILATERFVEASFLLLSEGS